MALEQSDESKSLLLRFNEANSSNKLQTILADNKFISNKEFENNHWYLLTWVYDGSTISFYIDGVLDTSIGASDIRALLGVLRAGDIALFVTSGTFSPDAKATGTSSREFIRLIDGDEFIDMWLEFYDKMSDDDKNMLPLKRIAFLGNNE